MAGDGAGDGDGDGEGEGHPGLSDSSASNTSGMAGPAGMGIDTSGTQSETLSFNNPNRAGTIGFGHPGLSDAAAQGTHGMAGPAVSDDSFMDSVLGLFAPDLASVVTGINPMGRGLGQDSSAADLGITGDSSDSDSSNGPDGGLLANRTSLLPSAESVASLLPYVQPQRQQYQYGQGRWEGNQFIPAPIMRTS